MRKILTIIFLLVASSVYAAQGLDTKTMLLIHFRGVNGSTTITDSAQYNKTINNVGGYVVINNSSTYGAFGYSGLFGQTPNYAYARIVPNNQAQTDWWTNTYQIDCWVYPIAYNSTTLYPNVIGQGSIPWAFGLNSIGQLGFYYWNGSPEIITSAANVPLNTLTHIAMVQANNIVYLKINDAVVNSAAIIGTPDHDTTQLTIGEADGYSFIGYISEIRIEKGSSGIIIGNALQPTAPYAKKPGLW